MIQLLTIRFPSGETEHRLSARSPKVGDLVNRDGDAWVVEEVSTTDDGAMVVALRPNLFLLAGGWRR